MFKGLKVIDGDKHDMRFLDETQVVVGLIEKGEAKKDTSGFVIDLINVRAIWLKDLKQLKKEQN